MKTIDGQIMETCFRHGSKKALEQKVASQWQPLSYSELWRKSGLIVSGLQTFGIQKTERTAILAAPSPQWVIACLGILRSGAVAVPVDKDLKSGEIRHILANCKARIVFSDELYLDMLLPLLSDLPHLRKIVVIHPETTGKSGPALELAINDVTNEWRNLKSRLKIPEKETEDLEKLAEKLYSSLLQKVHPSVKKAESFSQFLSDSSVLRRQMIKKRRLVDLPDFTSATPPSPSSHEAGDPAVIIYTSGTTGVSKGAVLSHANILSNICSAIELYGITSQTHLLSVLPIHHVFELVLGIILPLAAGGTISFVESLKKVGTNLEELKPDFFLGVPAIYRVFHKRIDKKIKEDPFSRWLFRMPVARGLIQRKIRRFMGGDKTIFISGGAALDPEIAAGLKDYGLTIYQGYGITETSPVIALEAPGSQRLGLVGKLLPGVKVKIDAADEDGVGEILVQGPNVMLGYFNNPLATAAVFRDGWYHSGDLGRLDKDGYLYVCGRMKNLIVTPNGKNVYPEEIENELLKSNFIAEIMVYGHKVGPMVEEVHAQIYPNQEAIDTFALTRGKSFMSLGDVEKLIRDEVQKHCQNLAAFKRIKKFTLREDEFPKTTTRKIKRFAVEAAIRTNE